MNAIEFKKFNLANLTPVQLAALVNTPNPAYLAFVNGEAMYMQTDGESADGTTGDESGLPADRLAIRKVVVYAQAEGKGTKVPLVISYRTVGEMDDTVTFRLIGQASARLVENANATGKSLLQTKIDTEQNPETQIAVFRKNGGGAFKVEAAAQYFKLDELTAIDASTGQDAAKHQLVIAGNKGGTPTIARFSPHTGAEIDAASRIQLPADAKQVTSVAIDRRTLVITLLAAFGTNTRGFANADGTPETTEVKALNGAESVRMKKTGLYAFNKKGETVYFQRKADDAIDLTTGNIVLSGTDASVFRLHDVQVEDDSATGRTKRTATFTARDQSTTGARQWTTAALAA